jgi:5-hydroxyisourate hydrolase-like protein (transthyretin family)
MLQHSDIDSLSRPQTPRNSPTLSLLSSFLLLKLLLLQYDPNHIPTSRFPFPLQLPANRTSFAGYYQPLSISHSLTNIEEFKCHETQEQSTHTSPMASSVLYHITVRVTDTRTSRTAFDLSVYLCRDANEEMELQGKTDSAGRIDKWSYRSFGGAYGTTWSIPSMMEYFLRGWWSLEFLIGDYFQEETMCGRRC